MKVILACTAALLISSINSSLLVDRVYPSDSFAEGIPMKVVYNIYNNYPVYCHFVFDVFFSDISDVEVIDTHFSNQDQFEGESSSSFKVPLVKSNEKHEHIVLVTPKTAGEHKLHSASYSYKINGEIIKGVSTNKP